MKKWLVFGGDPDLFMNSGSSVIPWHYSSCIKFSPDGSTVRGGGLRCLIASMCRCTACVQAGESILQQHQPDAGTSADPAEDRHPRQRSGAYYCLLYTASVCPSVCLCKTTVVVCVFPMDLVYRAVGTGPA